jgi:hypothetical protein
MPPHVTQVRGPERAARGLPVGASSTGSSTETPQAGDAERAIPTSELEGIRRGARGARLPVEDNDAIGARVVERSVSTAEHDPEEPDSEDEGKRKRRDPNRSA